MNAIAAAASIATNTFTSAFGTSSSLLSSVDNIIDILLIILNLFNVIVGILPRIVPPYCALYKNFLMKFQYNTVKLIHSVPLITNFVKLSLLIVTIYFAMNANVMNVVVANSDDNASYNNSDINMIYLCRALVSGCTLLCTVLLVSLSDALLSLGLDRAMEIEQEIDFKGIINFKPVPKQVAQALMTPINTILQTETHGIENVNNNNNNKDGEQASLFVMNHSLMGLEMAPFVNTLYQEKNVYVRGLADHFHFMSPHGEILRNVFGAVDGTRSNVDCLMENNQNVLVYPGGANEIMKHSDTPKYELLWKQRLGFARMAIKHGYPIIPCAAVGTEDMLNIMADIPVHFVRKNLTCPVVSMNPKNMQKIYFWFGEPISTKQYNGEYMNDAFATEVRDKTKTAVLSGIEAMKVRQQNDPDRYLIHQFANKFQKAKNDFANQVLPRSIFEGTANVSAGREECPPPAAEASSCDITDDDDSLTNSTNEEEKEGVEETKKNL